MSVARRVGSGNGVVVAGPDQSATTSQVHVSKHESRAEALKDAGRPGPYERFFKYPLDRVAGLVLTLITLPAVAILAFYVLVRIGRPILYREDRVGKNEKVFKMNRFRTLRVALSADEEFESRILPAGRFLRRWSLDELPQLWNISLGHMSLVGPRPERIFMVDAYEPWQHTRHQVKPGATGLWQVTARGDGRHMHENVEVDLRYIDRLSFLYDVRILSKTIGVVLRRPEKPSVIPGVVDTLALPKRSWGETGYLMVKRVVDLLISGVLLVTLSPVALVVAVATKLDSPGPVLYRQVRVGLRGQLFRVVKLRTMVVDASDELHRSHYEELAVMNEPDAIRLDHDPRITRTGRFLRSWSIDELPNLWNVFRGEMSLVGPRPIVPYELDLYSPDDMRRLDAKPGITGMAQVEGRGDITMEQRVLYDLEYLERRSTWFDTKMLALTMRAVFKTRGY